MSPLQIQWDRIRRRWVLILVIGIVAAAGALGASLLQGTDLHRPGRADDRLAGPRSRAGHRPRPGLRRLLQPGLVAGGLRQTAGIDSSVAPQRPHRRRQPDRLRRGHRGQPRGRPDAATKMAVALRDDVNSSLGGDSQARQLADLQQQLAAAQGTSDHGARSSTLQDQISDLQGQSTNQLQDLQLNAGVVANPTNARPQRRRRPRRRSAPRRPAGHRPGPLREPHRHPERGPRPPRPPGARRRRRRRKSGENARNELLRALMGLTNALRHARRRARSRSPAPPRRARSKTRVAVALAGLRALQGQTTLLVQADFESDAGGPSELATMSGVADFLAERGDSRLDGKVFSNGRALLVSPPGQQARRPVRAVLPLARLSACCSRARCSPTW